MSREIECRAAIVRTGRAYAVQLLTASGVIAAFLAVAELTKDAPDERVVFAWLVGWSLIYPAFYATLSILIDPQRS